MARFGAPRIPDVLIGLNCNSIARPNITLAGEPWQSQHALKCRQLLILLRSHKTCHVRRNALLALLKRVLTSPTQRLHRACNAEWQKTHNWGQTAEESAYTCDKVENPLQQRRTSVKRSFKHRIPRNLAIGHLKLSAACKCKVEHSKKF